MSDSQVSSEVYSDFALFGKYIYYAGIFFIISILVPFVGSVGLIVVIIMGLQRIKNANEKLQDPNLHSFYTNLLISQVCYLIGSIVAFISVYQQLSSLLSMLNNLSANVNSTTQTSSSLTQSNTFLVPSLIGTGIEIIGWILSYMAWGRLRSFFEQKQIFPRYINQQAVDNIGKLRTASLMYILAFLIITACIGLIFFIMGYFGLGNALKEAYPTESPYPQEPSLDSSYRPSSFSGSTDFSTSGPSTTFRPSSTSGPSTTTGTGTPEVKFCPKCGTPIKEPAKFCPVCGNPIKKYDKF